MYLVIRTKDEKSARILEYYLRESSHKVSLEGAGGATPVPTNAEFITMGMADTIGLSPPIDPFRVVIAKTPAEAAWLPSPLLITGMTLDRNYDYRDEILFLWRAIYDEVSRYNISSRDKIISVGVHLDILNMRGLSIPSVTEVVLRSIGSGSNS